eukprot:CAMPEP_0180382086 /NCGR_PEP_ID=MMETSP0989-20121125/27142_1 /TAXON_ID=697907 /ORGANISM="non described non described, Strain CCMP2293" /LENGTH=102 /DNA_ID=CAMNT_0022382107 /DNA_START=129 /DNA_END=437 /DNA_ORIENTATION=-
MRQPHHSHRHPSLGRVDATVGILAHLSTDSRPVLPQSREPMQLGAPPTELLLVRRVLLTQPVCLQRIIEGLANTVERGDDQREQNRHEIPGCAAVEGIEEHV